MEDNVTESYVRKILAQALQDGSTPQIALPPELDEELKRTQERVGKSWDVEKAVMKEKLSALRAGYLENMKKHAKGFDAKLGNQTIEMPALTVNLEFDFSELQTHQKQMANLKKELDEAERKKFEIEEQLALGKLTEDEARKKIKETDDAVKQARRKMDNLGECPSPRRYTERVKTSDWGSGFLWLSATYEDRVRTDDSAGDAWRENRKILRQEVENIENIKERLQKEAEAKTGQRMNVERASKLAQEVADKQERKFREAQQKQKELEKNMVNETVKKLRGQTLIQLEQAIEALDIYAKETVKATFTEQANLLKAAIDEKLLEPLNAEIAQKQAIQDVIAKGEAAVQAERIRLAQGLKNIQDVQRMTLEQLRAV